MTPAVRAGTFLLAVLAAACADDRGQPRFDLRYAPGFAQQNVSMSVFGVFKDGRMSAEAWSPMAAHLSPWLDANSCELAYGKVLLKNDGPLADAIEERTAANGVSDELLDLFADRARGDEILTLVVSGEVGASDAGASPAPSQPMPARRGRGRRGAASAGGAPPGAPPNRGSRGRRGTLEMQVYLYSVKLRRSVAVLTMTYDGDSLDQALDRFRAELQKELPGATCTGWNAIEDVVPESIRELPEP